MYFGVFTRVGDKVRVGVSDRVKNRDNLHLSSWEPLVMADCKVTIFRLVSPFESAIECVNE